MEDMGKGIATAGIWISVAVCAFSPIGMVTVAVAFFAAIGTYEIWSD